MTNLNRDQGVHTLKIIYSHNMHPIETERPTCDANERKSNINK